MNYVFGEMLTLKSTTSITYHTRYYIKLVGSQYKLYSGTDSEQLSYNNMKQIMDRLKQLGWRCYVDRTGEELTEHTPFKGRVIR